MRLLKTLVVIAAFTLGTGAAQAQILVGEESRDFRGTDSNKTAETERDAAIAGTRTPPRRAKGSRAVPADPDDVTVGSEILDPKGVVLGKVESVSMSAAVVAAAGGKVEVPLESFGKNNKGLLLALTKSEFDAAVAAANKPGD